MTVQRPNEIIISITSRCNLRCAMCQIHGVGRDRELNVLEMSQLVMDAISLHPQSIVFTGGEPLLREDVFDLVALASRSKIKACLISNGTLLTHEVARRLQAAGIGVVNISVEGDNETHDLLRGTGSFIKTVQALKSLSGHGIETVIATTVSRQNYAALPKVIELARRFGVMTVKFQPFSDVLLKDKKIRERFLVPEALLPEMERRFAEVIRLADEGGITTNPKEYLLHIPSYLCGKPGLKGQQKGCGGLWTSCPVSAGGDVHPCWSLEDRVIGNVRTEKLSAIWGSPNHEQVREEILRQGCGGCMMSSCDQHFGKQDFNPGTVFMRKQEEGGPHGDPSF